MGTIIVNNSNTRKNGLPILGDGCINCKVRDKCHMTHCNYVSKIRYQGMSDLASDYHYYMEDLKLETYVRKYKHGYFLLVNGEKYNSGEIETGWRFQFYNKDMSDSKHGLSNNGIEVEKHSKRYLYVKYLKSHYEINDYVPLENSKGILLF